MERNTIEFEMNQHHQHNSHFPFNNVDFRSMCAIHQLVSGPNSKALKQTNLCSSPMSEGESVLSVFSVLLSIMSHSPVCVLWAPPRYWLGSE